jgi:ubiquinone/menaquinone biosynthesis C-methylase UbiE
LGSIESILRQIEGGLVLDLATLEGHLVRILDEHLQYYQQIVGTDIDEKSIHSPAKDLTNEKILFIVMDAERLAFEDNVFDSINISASLHHLANVQHVLGAMLRVLKPGGQFILGEMYGDAYTEATQTSISQHQWVTEVDSAPGWLHRKTFSRQEFVDCIARLALSKVEYADIIYNDSDPKEMARTAQLERLIAEPCSALKEQLTQQTLWHVATSCCSAFKIWELKESRSLLSWAPSEVTSGQSISATMSGLEMFSHFSL